MTDTLKDKLRAMVKERLTSPLGTVYADGLKVMELEGLIELLELQVISDEPVGGYRVLATSISLQLGNPHSHDTFSVMGPGVASYPGDVPAFERSVDAEATCRCLSRAFRAGESHRAAAIAALLEPRR